MFIWRFLCRAHLLFIWRTRGNNKPILFLRYFYYIIKIKDWIEQNVSFYAITIFIFKLIITSIAKGKSLGTSIVVNSSNDEETLNCLLSYNTAIKS